MYWDIVPSGATMHTASPAWHFETLHKVPLTSHAPAVVRACVHVYVCLYTYMTNVALHFFWLVPPNNSALHETLPHCTVITRSCSS